MGLGSALGAPLSVQEMGREALAVYKWFVEQTAAGRVVAAVDPDCTRFTRLATPHVHANRALNV